jgi:outer membrane protein
MKGLENNPRLTAARSLVDASEASVGTALSGFYPRLDFSESFSRTNNPMWAFGTRLNQGAISMRDFDPALLNDPDSISNFTTALSVTMPLYEQGRIRIGLNQARLDREATSLMAQRVRQEVIAWVVAAYYGILLAQEHLRVVDQALDTARAHYRMAQSRYRQGLTVKSDLLRAQVRISELVQERVNAGSQEAVARATLNAAMGVEVGRKFNPATPLDKESASPGALETWIQESMKRRPDLKRIRFQELMVEQEVAKARAARLPGVHLRGSYEINSEDFSETGNNYTLGVLMRFNLFNGFETRSKVQEAMADLRRAQAVVRQVELAVEVETRRAFFGAQSAHERIRAAEAAEAQAEEGLRIVRNRYKSGLFTIVNLLDAEVSLQQARTHCLRSLHDYKVATAQLHLAAGTIDETFR